MSNVMSETLDRIELSRSATYRSHPHEEPDIGASSIDVDGPADGKSRSRLQIAAILIALSVSRLSS